MLLVAPLSTIRPPSRPFAEDDWKHKLDVQPVSSDVHQFTETAKPPLPPLSPEGLAAVRVLADESADADAVIAAARTLSLFHEAAAPHAALLVRRLGDERSEVRRVVAYAIGQLGKAAVSPHAAALVDCLGDEDAGIQMILKNALQATGKLGAEALAAKVAAGDGPAAQAAMQILPAMGSEGAAALAAQLPLPDADANRRVVSSFMRLGKAGIPYLEAVADLMNHSNAGVRKDASEAVGRAGAAGGPYVHLIARLLQGSDSSERACALEALERIGRPASIHLPLISAALCDVDKAVQLKAVKALGGIAAASLNPDPLTDLDDESWTLSDEGSAAMMIHLSQQTKGVIESLKRMGCFGGAMLSTQLFSKKAELRKHCLEALVSMGPRDPESQSKSEAPRELHVGAGALAVHLGSKDPSVRLMLCGALGSCGKCARGHAWTLKEMWDGNGKAELQDESQEVRKAAMTAITKMNSKKGSERNVLLTDPTIVAMSVPAQTKRDAGKLVEIMKSMLARFDALQNASMPMPVHMMNSQRNGQHKSRLRCLPFFGK